MKTLLITNIRGLKKAPDKQAYVDELLGRLKLVAKEKKTRLGSKCELINDDSVRITVAKDEFVSVIRDVVQRAGMKVDDRSAADAFVALYGENEVL
jgi:hypothetical protein